MDSLKKYSIEPLEGIEEWLNNTDAKYMTFEEMEEENKRLKEIQRKNKWLEKEYELFASSTNPQKFTKDHAGYYKEESEERLSQIFSRYFGTKDENISSYDVFSQFFKDFKTSLVRWSKMPSEIRIKNVYMENPYRLKNMPSSSQEFKNLAKEVISLLVQMDESEIENYLTNIENKYEQANLTEFQKSELSKKTLSSLKDDHKKFSEQYNLAVEDFDERGYNSKHVIEAIDKSHQNLKHNSQLIEIKESLIPFEDLRFREDFSPEDYKSFQASKKRS